MPGSKTSFSHERTKAVARLIQSGYIHTPSVIRAMQHVPREEFLPEALRERARLCPDCRRKRTADVLALVAAESPEGKCPSSSGCS